MLLLTAIDLQKNFHKIPNQLLGIIFDEQTVIGKLHMC